MACSTTTDLPNLEKLVTKCLLFKKMCGLTYSFKQLLHEFDSHVVEFFFGASPVQ